MGASFALEPGMGSSLRFASAWRVGDEAIFALKAQLLCDN